MLLVNSLEIYDRQLLNNLSLVAKKHTTTRFTDVCLQGYVAREK